MDRVGRIGNDGEVICAVPHHKDHEDGPNIGPGYRLPTRHLGGHPGFFLAGFFGDIMVPEDGGAATRTNRATPREAAVFAAGAIDTANSGASDDVNEVTFNMCDAIPEGNETDWRVDHVAGEDTP